MEEQKIEEGFEQAGNIGEGYTPAENIGEGTTNFATANLPQQVSVWSKVKAFLLQDVNRDVVVTMTPYQEKVLKEVHDFWFQPVDFKKVKNFLWQDITLGVK